ncbi:MAG: cadmium-translocating P-type ATPase [Oscillospiraceae bacterium]|nr:cadmium-translocating P-type ATPase [Oscillospiraceae bacterium]
MHQTLTVRTEHAIAEELSSAVERIVHRHEPDIEIIAHEHEHHHEHEAEHDHDHCGCGHEHAHEQEHEHHHEHEAEHDHEHCACGHEHAHEAEHAHQHAHAEEHALLFTLKGLDCPHCSAKIEHDVAALPAVEAASVNLMQQTLAVHAPAADRGRLIAAVTEIVHKHEPDVEVIAQADEDAFDEDALLFTLKGLDCPHCSAKIEHDVAALAEVEAASVNLMQQTLAVHAPAADRDQLIAAVTEIVHKHEPDVEVIAQTAQESVRTVPAQDDRRADRIMTARIIAGAVVFFIGLLAKYIGHAPAAVVLTCMVIAYIILGWDVVWKAIRNITKGQIFDEHFLMSISTVGAFVLGEYPEAVAVMLFYQIGEFFQSLAVKRSRKSIASLLDIRPDTANVMRNGSVTEVPAERVRVGELILVKAGERVPLDGTVTEGESMLDTVALTGESVPRHVRAGDAALSGCINQSGALTVQVTKPFRESTASKIIDMVENASARKAPTENFITTFARYYTPVVVILAVLLAVVPPLLLHGAWADWIHRAFVFLIVSCPCALVISIPLTFFSGIGAASKAGVLVKGSNDLEALSKVSQLVFDKTGTLTKGVFRVSSLYPADGCNEETLLQYAAGCERQSNHPIAKSVLAAYNGDPDALDVSSCGEISGKGIHAVIGGENVLAGSAKLMQENGIRFAEIPDPGTKVYVAADGRYIGCILIADELKPDTADALQKLRRAGIGKMVMLTGDDRAIAKSVASELKLDGCYAQLLPDEKVSRLESLLKDVPAGEKLAFVGDGINDAPVLARADVGIAMGALGADAAIEAADVVLMTDEPARLADAISVARKTKRIVMQNIVFALGVKILLLILGACGLVGMWWAVFGDVGVTLLAVLNALRAMQHEKKA